MKNLFTFEGRINRAKYIQYYLLLDLTSYYFKKILKPIDNSRNLCILILLVLLSAMFNTYLKVKRLNDLNRPGYHYLLTWIPIYILYMFWILTFNKGTDGSNEYGEDPLGIKEVA